MTTQQQPTITNADAFRAMMAHHYRGGSYAHLWRLSGRRSDWFSVGDLPDTTQGLADDTYFSVNPTTEIPPANSKGEPKEPPAVKAQNAYIAGINVLYAEFDTDDKAHTLAELDAMQPAPSVVIDSGGGFHCYWWLNAPFVITDDADREWAKLLQYAWVDFTGSDGGAKDLARILRVPGTRNAKYSPPRPVEIVHWHPERLYTLEELEAAAAAELDARMAEEVHTSSPPAPSVPVDLDDQELIERAKASKKNGAKFTRLWNGDASDHIGSNGEPDESAADLALCNLLAFWTGRDMARIDRLFRQSGLYRDDKWGAREDYRMATLEKAVKTRQTYDWDKYSTDQQATQPAQAAVGDLPGLSKGKRPTPSSSGAQGQQATAGNGNGQANGQKPKQADLLYQLVVKNVELFTAQDGEAYAFCPIDGRRECHKLRTMVFREYATGLFYDAEGTIPGSQAQQDAIRLLSWRARQTRRDVHVRVAGHDDKIYIDIGDATWMAIEVDANGWRIVDQPPVAFTRARGVEALPIPQSGSDVALLRKFLNVNDEYWPMIAAWVLAAMRETGPYPILLFTGEQGTAKSSATQVMKSIIDPSAAALGGAPQEIDPLMIAANNRWVLAFDNMSNMRGEISDALCRVATGGGYAKRGLYTDTDEVLIDVTRPIVMNGIASFANRGDFMDRALVVELEPIDDTERMTEKEFWRAFNAERPAILGAFLDALSFALGSLPHTTMQTKPRMADFALLATAVEPVLGLEKGRFEELYTQNREESTDTVLGASPIASALKSIFQVDETWEGTSRQLLKTLNSQASDQDKASKQWPTASNKLSSELTRVAPALRAAKIVDIRKKTVRGSKKWVITRLEDCRTT